MVCTSACSEVAVAAFSRHDICQGQVMRPGQGAEAALDGLGQLLDRCAGPGA